MEEGSKGPWRHPLQPPPRVPSSLGARPPQALWSISVLGSDERRGQLQLREYIITAPPQTDEGRPHQPPGQLPHLGE